MKQYWDDYFPIIVMVAIFCGLTGQFIWKMIYFPEPIVPVVIELVCTAGVIVLAAVMSLRH